MNVRLSRAEQNDRNRALLLSAALRVFLSRGYHAASLEQIADEAGFSKGAMYSRFESKADMFLALLRDRIAARAAENAAAVAELASSGTVAGLVELAWQAERATPGWRLLVTEFRVVAARDPVLNQRYAAAHATTVDAVTSILSAMAERDGISLAVPARRLAELLLAIETGIALEQLASPDAIDIREVAAVLRQLVEIASPAATVSREVRQS
jgi:AcrR family transcriptional regulator